VREPAGATDFWATVHLLLSFARRRSKGRAEHQRRLLGNKGQSGLGTGLGTFFVTIVALFVHGAAAALLYQAMGVSPRLHAEARGQRLVSESCLEILAEEVAPGKKTDTSRVRLYCREDRREGTYDERNARVDELIEHYRRHGVAGTMREDDRQWPLARGSLWADPLATVLGSVVLAVWFLMLAFQGEGADLDLQRRRHPMWEWLLSHPVEPRAVFLAEMLSPLAANLFLLTAPVFWIGAFWMSYGDPLAALLAGLAAGIPISVAAGCLSKTVEITALLRLAPRSRGAVLGLLSWVGYASYMLMLFTALSSPVVVAVSRWLLPLAALGSWPLVGGALGLYGTPAAWKGVLACWAAAAVLIAACVQFAARATRQGLAGGFGDVPDAPRALSARQPAWLRRDPLYRKELLWLWRDRGALIQVFLIPLTIAGFQLINLRHMVMKATQGWHLMSGATVIFGSYFLWVLGPRSLLSEGAALWIPLTWPRGLEDLLRTKARLWWMASGVIVGPLLLITAIRFPGDAWKVALVALAWTAFSRSLADKSVTLVGTPTSSGEMEPVPKGRQWAASLGMFTFGVGILSQQWSLAFAGVAYSWMTMAALWQNFRARLPYLFDPWSETLPTPPTLMHAMVAISAMIEAGAIVLALVVAFVGPESAPSARAVTYALVAAATGIAVSGWLAGRDVRPAALWRWDDSASVRRALLGSAAALAMGLTLGAFAIGYSWLAQRVPGWEQAFEASRRMLADSSTRRWLAVMAVGVAPLAEEFLFRGLLFRALDREWDGGAAVWGSACFFAIYHPPLAWIPVGLLGAACAVLFKRSGHLIPCVLLHMTYNAVVVWAG
jgi:membrane protease YdiL (CAAX protease family)